MSEQLFRVRIEKTIIFAQFKSVLLELICKNKEMCYSIIVIFDIIVKCIILPLIILYLYEVIKYRSRCLLIT